MTPEAIEALALRRAAEVAQNVRGTFDECHDATLFTASDIADSILSLAPMTPLQAALEVPEVRAVIDQLWWMVDGATDEQAVLLTVAHVRKLRAALAALEEHHD